MANRPGPAAGLFISIALASFAGGAQAALVISASPTANVTCSSNICTATAADAVLNAKELQGLLAGADSKVVSGNQANDIEIEVALTWVSASQLTLDVAHSVIIDKPVSVTGPGGIKLITKDGSSTGKLSFGRKGRIEFWNLTSSFVINAGVYTLIDNIAALAGDIAADPSGKYALARNYDATPDGIYASSPIATQFTGKFDGLGNTITNLAIHQPSGPGVIYHYVGLFSQILEGGVVRNISLTNVRIAGGQRAYTGALAGFNSGSIRSSFAEGSVTGKQYALVGGLVGVNAGNVLSSYTSGTATGADNSFVGGLAAYSSGNGPTVRISNSHSTVRATGGNGSHVGGLVGISGNIVERSWATGAVSVGSGNGSLPAASAGGLIGYNSTNGGSNDATVVKNCYARGAVTGGQNALVGGLIGISGVLFAGIIENSYADGSVTSGAGSSVGGLIGYVYKKGSTDTYWDTTTSGISDPTRGAGNIAKGSGIKGLPTVKLQSRLPEGFSDAIWARNRAIDGGLPYLLSNPPP